IAVTRDHEVDDLVIAPAFAEHAVDLAAQVVGDRRVRFGDVLVLALGAAQHRGQVAIALTLAVVGELVGVDGRQALPVQARAQHDGGDQAFHGAASCSSASYTGASFSRQTRSSMTPTYFSRM